MFYQLHICSFWSVKLWNIIKYYCTILCKRLLAMSIVTYHQQGNTNMVMVHQQGIFVAVEMWIFQMLSWYAEDWGVCLRLIAEAIQWHWQKFNYEDEKLVSESSRQGLERGRWMRFNFIKMLWSLEWFNMHWWWHI